MAWANLDVKNYNYTPLGVDSRRVKHLSVYLVPLVILLALVELYFHFPNNNTFETVHTNHATPLPASYLHVLIAATHGSVNFCKAELGTEILGYSTPTIVNWNTTIKTGMSDLGPRIDKIRGVYNYLAQLDHYRDNDIVLLLDGHDVWMQLRPQTLLDRYFAINKRADATIVKRLGKTASTHGIRQDIVFSSQKRCQIYNNYDAPCYAVPESPLPRDIYGPLTDKEIHGDTKNPYGKYRQRFLNSGVAMGTVASLRALYAEVLVRTQKNPENGNDQRILTEIFGDQEIYRELLRRQTFPASSLSKLSTFLGRDRFNPKHLAEVAAQALTKSLDYSIGLDYFSEISFSTVSSDTDADFIHYSNPIEIAEAEQKRGIKKSAIKRIATDISTTLPPYWTYTTETLPQHLSWSNLSLYTNIYTGITPALIHHNADREDINTWRHSWWTRIWYQGHARELYSAHIYNPLTPIAQAGYNESTQALYWSPEMWKGGWRNGPGNRTHRAEWLRFEWDCRGHEKEIFRDSKGPWKLPDNH